MQSETNQEGHFIGITRVRARAGAPRSAAKMPTEISWFPDVAARVTTLLRPVVTATMTAVCGRETITREYRTLYARFSRRRCCGQRMRICGPLQTGPGTDKIANNPLNSGPDTGKVASCWDRSQSMVFMAAGKRASIT